MAQTAPIIQGETLTYQQDGQPTQVVVGTSGWYGWLETAFIERFPDNGLDCLVVSTTRITV